MKKVLKKILKIIILIIIVPLASCTFYDNILKYIYVYKHLKETNILLNPKLLKIDTNINIAFPEKPFLYKDLTYTSDKKLKSNLFGKIIINTSDYSQRWAPEYESISEFHMIGESEYILNELIYDKSKGNHFEKIEEYIEENKEEILKLIYGEDFRKEKLYKDEDIKIYFRVRKYYVLENNEYTEYMYYKLKRLENEDHFYILKEMEEEEKRKIKDKIYKKESEFFKEKIRVSDIDWEKYTKYMKVYPILYMSTGGDDDSNDIENIGLEAEQLESGIEKKEDIQSDRALKLNELYKKFEKWYNRETFDFGIKS